VVRRRWISIAVLAVCLSAKLLSEATQQIRLDATKDLDLGNLKAEVVRYRGRACVHIENTRAQDSDYGEGLANRARNIVPRRRY
jgi:hypothetical protein